MIISKLTLIFRQAHYDSAHSQSELVEDIAFAITKYLSKLIVTLLTLISFSINASAQGCGSLIIHHQADITSTCNFMVMTMIHDTQDRPYLYVANKEAGLKIYDISTITSPSLVATTATSLYNSLDVMNLSQNGNYLYLALGNSFTNPQQGGMAIVDVTNPLSPIVTDSYVVPSSGSGGGIVKVEGNYAYLGAMQSGLIVLDITDKSNITFASQYIPDINYPDSNNPNAALYNARGMEVKNSIVYLCYDAGGIRIINCTNKLAPVQTGKYSNLLLNGKPRAYNNVILDDSLLYVTFDYCGLVVLNVSDTSNITEIGWWNPNNCVTANWFACPIHTNELQYNKDCKKLFIATGKSDMYVLDISNPSAPDSCDAYGGISNNIGTWGVGLYQDQIYLSYVCAIIPFVSNWTGVKILTYSPCVSSGINVNEQGENEITIYPSPANNFITIGKGDIRIDSKKYTISIINILGKTIKTIGSDNLTVDISDLNDGVYLLQLNSNNQVYTKKFIKSTNLEQ